MSASRQLEAFEMEIASRETLIAHIDNLQFRLDCVSQALTPDRVLQLRRAFNLSQAQGRLLAILADGKPHSHTAIYNGMYSDRLDAPTPKMISVLICHLRKRLASSPLKIRTVHAGGYQLTGSEHLERLMAEPPESSVEDTTSVQYVGDLLVQLAGMSRRRSWRLAYFIEMAAIEAHELAVQEASS